MNNSISEIARSVADELAKQLATTPYGQVGVNITTHGGAAKHVEYTRRVSILLGSTDASVASNQGNTALLLVEEDGLKEE